MIGKRLKIIVWLFLSQQLLMAQGNEIAMNVNAFTFTSQKPSEEVVLTSFLEEVEKEYKVYFNYDPELLKGKMIDQEVDLSANLEHTLNKLLVTHNLRIEKMGDNFYAILPAEEALRETKKERPLPLILPAANEVKSTPTRKSQIKALEKRTLESPTFYVAKFLDRASTITGKVTDQDGDPLIGVNVIVKGTNQGTATDFNGEFILSNVEDDATLVISYIGYQTREIKVDGRSAIDIVLTEDSQVIDEVVVVGYSSVERRHLASSIETMDMSKV